MFTRVLSNAYVLCFLILYTPLLLNYLMYRAKDIVVFMLIFLIVFIGFAEAFYVAFHVNVSGFENFSSSLFSLFRSILGDFNFNELQAENFVLGPALFIFFILVSPMDLFGWLVSLLNQKRLSLACIHGADECIPG